MALSREIINAIGLSAGTLTTVSFVPQLVKTVKHRSARELSYGMLLAFAAGVLLWLVYGVELHALPIILANAVTLALVAAILALKAYHQRETKR